MSSPTSGEEWISLHEAAHILNMKPSAMSVALLRKVDSRVRARVNEYGKLNVNRADVLALVVQE